MPWRFCLPQKSSRLALTITQIGIWLTVTLTITQTGIWLTVTLTTTQTGIWPTVTLTTSQTGIFHVKYITHSYCMKWFTFHCFESIFFNSVIDTLAALYKMTNNLLLIKALSSRWRQKNHPPPQSASASPCVDVAWCQHSAWPPSGLVMGPWWWTQPLPCAACDPALHTHTHAHTHVYTHAHTHMSTHTHT